MHSGRHIPTCANNIKQKVTKKTAFVSCKGRFLIDGPLDRPISKCYIQNIVIKHCFEKEGMTMAKKKSGVYDRVLECAKEEFLSKGFLDASLRTIAQEADTSTGSIYTRFGDKEGLFRAIAEPVVDQFKAMFRRVQELSLIHI